MNPLPGFLADAKLEVNLYKQAYRNKGSIGFGILENRVLNLTKLRMEGACVCRNEGGKAKPYKYIFLLILYTLKKYSPSNTSICACVRGCT